MSNGDERLRLVRSTLRTFCGRVLTAADVTALLPRLRERRTGCDPACGFRRLRSFEIDQLVVEIIICKGGDRSRDARDAARSA